MSYPRLPLGQVRPGGGRTWRVCRGWRSALAGPAGTGSGGAGQRSGAVVPGELRWPEVEAAGGPVEAAGVSYLVPPAGGDPVSEGQHAGDELGRAEVAVPEAVDERLPEQVAVARRADLMGVVALHLHGDEVVADGVQVECGDGQVPGRDRRVIERSDRGGVCRDVRVPGQVGQVSAEPEASRAVEGRDLAPERRPGQDCGIVHAGVPVGAAAVRLVD